MSKTTFITVAAMLLAATTARAQQPKSPNPPQTKPPAESEQRTPAKGEPPQSAKPSEAPVTGVNIKVDVTITDKAGPGEPAKKVISMITGNGQNNSIRSSAHVRVSNLSAPGAVPSFSYREVKINVDARPLVLGENKIRLNFGLQYEPQVSTVPQAITPGVGTEPVRDTGTASLNEILTLTLESGKPMMVSQAADPASDRQITVEVTATILK
jgi:hypothetical protein